MLYKKREMILSGSEYTISTCSARNSLSALGVVCVCVIHIRREVKKKGRAEGGGGWNPMVGDNESHAVCLEHKCSHIIFLLTS